MTLTLRLIAGKKFVEVGLGKPFSGEQLLMVWACLSCALRAFAHAVSDCCDAQDRAITHHDMNEQDSNPTYLELSRHHHFTLPAP